MRGDQASPWRPHEALLVSCGVKPELRLAALLLDGHGGCRGGNGGGSGVGGSMVVHFPADYKGPDPLESHL